MNSQPRPLRNVLFIMADQLRWDYLACSGHPTIRTPYIDALAARGVRFTNAFVQGPVCGASRMSTYTGRYVTSHGSAWNFVPLSVSQKTLGDHLRPLGVRCAVVGKTHVEADMEGAARLGIDTESDAGRLAMHGGFEPYERDDGIWPPGFKVEGNRYCDYLRRQGYGGDNPWHDYANSSLGADGALHSGWNLRWAREPARVAEEHSETPYMTRRAMDFITEQGDKPWVLHLSYIKPHWPYVAPDPYHAMYGARDVLPAQRTPQEKADPHPVYRGFMNYTPSTTVSRDEVREPVVPPYMGLLSQIDAQDPEVAASVRNLMFTFSDIVKLSDRELQSLLREVDQKDLVVALKGASEELKVKILTNMSEEVRTFITQEMEFLGPMRLSEVEEVQLRIVQQLRQLEEQGQITVVRGNAEDIFV